MSAKLAKYDRLYEQIKGYVQTTDDIWARLATMEAVLHHKMQTFFWTGVYALIDDELIVRSYQGPVEAAASYGSLLGGGQHGRNRNRARCGAVSGTYRL